MASSALKTTAPSSSAEQVLAALDAARERTLALVAGLAEQDLERVHSPIMSPLVWDLGHIAAYEDLWLARRLGGMELLRPDLAECYDAFETPRAMRGEVDMLTDAQARAYMRAVRERVTGTLVRDGVGDGVICEMVIRHELQHTETMRQTLDIAGLLSSQDRCNLDAPLEPERGPAWLEVPGGRFEMGAAQEAFAYDNERPRHCVDVPAFAIARQPVSNETWMKFSQGGGYERRQWWSPEGWAWRREHDIGPHPAVAVGHPRAPACHVSWFEADAFARSCGARLPTEAEWERAATAELPASAEDHFQRPHAPGPEAIGRVWEWTASPFGGYPGFEAHPYREYSEVFFGDDHRVLRGSSWATAGRVASVTFRNWDLPQRRQIFAGVRLARDLR